jgi:FkbM family methyltransferase
MNIKRSIIDIFNFLTPRKFLKLMVRDSIERSFIDSYQFKVSFSQQGEDLVLQNIFHNRPKGFYVDIGAFHPVMYSNTYVFYLKGWNGINVEPNPENIQLFHRSRNRDITLNLAVSDTKEELTYYQFNFPAVNTFIRENAMHWSGQPGHFIEKEIKITGKTLTGILDENLPEGTEIDFLSVDCEGMELEVLKSNNWQKYRPKIILTEFLFYEYENYRDSEIYQFITSLGYKFHSISGITMFFVEQNFKAD